MDKIFRSQIEVIIAEYLGDCRCAFYQHTRRYLYIYHSNLLSLSNKVGCILLIVVVSKLPQAEFGPNDHREDASNFNSSFHVTLGTVASVGTNIINAFRIVFATNVQFITFIHINTIKSISLIDWSVTLHHVSLFVTINTAEFNYLYRSVRYRLYRLKWCSVNRKLHNLFTLIPIATFTCEIARFIHTICQWITWTIFILCKLITLVYIFIRDKRTSFLRPEKNFKDPALGSHHQEDRYRY